ncbi:MAG: hypothetical protein AAF389_13370 [Gemmatimonadota bacterium]
MSVESSPSEVVAELWRRLEAEDYSGAAQLHTAGLAEYIREDAIREGAPRVHKPRTTEDMLAQNPDMPTPVAEWEAAQYRKQPAPPGYFGTVHGVESLEELEALTAYEVLARRIQATDWRTRLRPHLEELAGAHPEYRDQLLEQRGSDHAQHPRPLPHCRGRSGRRESRPQLSALVRPSYGLRLRVA